MLYLKEHSAHIGSSKFVMEKKYFSQLQVIQIATDDYRP